MEKTSWLAALKVGDTVGVRYKPPVAPAVINKRMVESVRKKGRIKLNDGRFFDKSGYQVGNSAIRLVPWDAGLDPALVRVEDHQP